MSKILGIDEAGRGSAIGDLVMCCALVDDSQIPTLKELGVKDSKAFKRDKNARQKRAAIAKELKEILPYKIHTASAVIIDNYVWNQLLSLNILEEEMAEYLIKWALNNVGLKPDQIILDSNQMFKNLAAKVRKNNPTVDCQAIDKADDKVMAASAASIIAKATRDQMTKDIMGNIFFSNGAGYCNQGSEEWIRSWYDPQLLSYPFVDIQPPITYVRQSFKWWKKVEDKLKAEIKMDQF